MPLRAAEEEKLLANEYFAVSTSRQVLGDSRTSASIKYNKRGIHLRVITEFKLGLSTDVAAVTRIFDDAGDAVGRRRTFVRVARLAVASRLPVLLAPLHLVRITITTVVVLAVLVEQLPAHQTTHHDDNGQHREMTHRLTLTARDRVLVAHLTSVCIRPVKARPALSLHLQQTQAETLLLQSD